jgi:hypothetical protein
MELAMYIALLKPHLNQREEIVREVSFRGDGFYIHQSQNASIITAIDRKILSPAASRLHWMHGPHFKDSKLSVCGQSQSWRL